MFFWSITIMITIKITMIFPSSFFLLPSSFFLLPLIPSVINPNLSLLRVLSECQILVSGY